MTIITIRRRSEGAPLADPARVAEQVPACTRPPLHRVHGEALGALALGRLVARDEAPALGARARGGRLGVGGPTCITCSRVHACKYIYGKN